MNWAYIAGLFDGDGSVAISRHLVEGKTSSVYMAIQITSIHMEFLLYLREWLKENGVTASISSPRKRTTRIQISGRNALNVFIKNVLFFTHLKRRQLEIIQEALTLRDQLKNNATKTIRENAHLFNSFRMELHELASKGPKTLTRW